MGNPRWPLGFSRLPDKPYFYLIGKAFPGCGVNNLTMEKNMVKIHFLQYSVIRAPNLLDRSYRHWQKFHELLGDHHFH